MKISLDVTRGIIGDDDGTAEIVGSDAMIDVCKERVRQTSKLGWSPEHDDAKTNGVVSPLVV